MLSMMMIGLMQSLYRIQFMYCMSNCTCGSSQRMDAAGAPFELSKRKRMTLFLFCRLANLALETIMTGKHVVCTLLLEAHQ